MSKNAMNLKSWTQAAGLCALLALALHGVSVLVPSDQGAASSSALCCLLLFLLVQSACPVALPLPELAGLLTDPASPPAASALSPTASSRGPPAA